MTEFSSLTPVELAVFAAGEPVIVLGNAFDEQTVADLIETYLAANPPTAADATASVKGVVQLAGDLGGTAAAPTVPGLVGLTAALSGKLDASAQGVAFGVFNVKAYGAVGDTVTDDTAAIQACIDASVAGSTIYFPPGTYGVSATIKLLKSRTYLGAGRELSTVRALNATNLDAVLASETWLSASSTSSDAPINISHLGVNGNKVNQTTGAGHAIVLTTFWNYLNDITVYNPLGDGVRLSAARRDGVELSGSAGVENHIDRVDVRGAGGFGIRVFDPSAGTQSVTDGWIRDCAIQNTDQDGIRIDTGAGWLVEGNHLYGTKKHGIHVGRADSTRVIGNYIESWGFSATAGSYAAIALGDGTTFTVAGNPNIVADNTAFFLGSSYGTVASGTFIRGLLVTVTASATAHLAVTGNAMVSYVTTAGGNTTIGLRPSGQTGSTLNLAESGNLFQGFGTTESINVVTVARVDNAPTKAALVHTHPQSDVTNLTTDLAAKAPLSHTHTASAVTDFNTAADARVVAGITGKLDTSAAPELIRDTIATALVAGTNVTITPNDAGDTIEIAATGGGGGITTEDARDAVAAMLAVTGNATGTNNDAGDTYTINVPGNPLYIQSGTPTPTAPALWVKDLGSGAFSLHIVTP